MNYSLNFQIPGISRKFADFNGDNVFVPAAGVTQTTFRESETADVRLGRAKAAQKDFSL